LRGAHGEVGASAHADLVLPAGGVDKDGSGARRGGLSSHYATHIHTLRLQHLQDARVEKEFVWWALLAQLTENTKHVSLLLQRYYYRQPSHVP
jgi:hypothetical protein